MRYSASRLKAWSTCPLAAHYKYDELLPDRTNAKATFGSVIHFVLDKYNTGTDVERCIELFKEYWKDPERLGLTLGYWPKYTSYASLRDKGVEIIRTYHEKNRWESREILASEFGFLVPFGEHELQGYVDYLELRKAGNGRLTLRVVDLKTASRMPNKVELRLDQQFTCYLYAAEQPEFFMGNGPDFPGLPNGEEVWQRMRGVPRRGVWFHLMTCKEIDAGPRDDGDFARLYRLCKEIDKAIEAAVFVPNIGEACIFCAYNEPCGIEVPNRDELDLEVL